MAKKAKKDKVPFGGYEVCFKGRTDTLEDLFDFDRAPSRDATVLLPEHDVRCRQ